MAPILVASKWPRLLGVICALFAFNLATPLGAQQASGVANPEMYGPMIEGCQFQLDMPSSVQSHEADAFLFDTRPSALRYMYGPYGQTAWKRKPVRHRAWPLHWISAAWRAVQP